MKTCIIFLIDCIISLPIHKSSKLPIMAIQTNNGQDYVMLNHRF
jgi:hypothetical protein